LGLVLRPAFAALEHAALRDPPVEWIDSAPAGRRPLGVTPFRISTLHPVTPVAVAAFGPARQQKFAHNHHSFLQDRHSFLF
jgi:hypothetical protein